MCNKKAPRLYLGSFIIFHFLNDFLGRSKLKIHISIFQFDAFKLWRFLKGLQIHTCPGWYDPRVFKKVSKVGPFEKKSLKFIQFNM